MTAVFGQDGACCTGGDLYIATRDALDDPFTGIRRLQELEVGDNSSEIYPSLSPDGLALFFSDWGVERERPGAVGLGDIWVATREDRDAQFRAPRNLGRPINSVQYEASPFVQGNWPHENATLYFVRCELDCSPDRNQIYQATWKPAVPFLRGDSNTDGKVDIADGVFTLGHLFDGGQAPLCRDAADTDDSGQIDIADSIQTFNWLFLAGAAPASPGPEVCGVDPTANDNLDCAGSAACPR